MQGALSISAKKSPCPTYPGRRRRVGSARATGKPDDHHHHCSATGRCRRAGTGQPARRRAHRSEHEAGDRNLLFGQRGLVRGTAGARPAPDPRAERPVALPDPGQPEHLIEGPSLCTIANDGDFTSAQIYGTDKPLRYTIVQLGVEALDSRLGWLPEQLIRRPGGDPRIMSCPAPRAMQALASQIATCQMLGPTRDLYLGGKALELAALSAQFLSGEGRPVEEPRITCSEVERIHAARDLLVGALQEPPSLDTLASRVGMNPRKLTAGFRKVFGASVFGYLQEYRLREAHRMLCDEEANVSTVAYRVGYSPAHFSIAFRKRYGISPSEIR